ncbi:ParB N-terminal domain-containing protein [Maribellus sp. CM-23]|uniref:DNA methyltransferase n=1 Tax=Maribellus sp. CM-23 TaxID=2781026 RepID=UPI001F2B82DF|nr:DNA methyltransferase [Maribellus sp. CM-23]MCE4566045.1 ParB N-terminal domain-containing protein [Maribellus sp. CM-23]
MESKKTNKKETSNEVVNESVNGSSVELYNGLNKSNPMANVEDMKAFKSIFEVYENKDLSILKLTIKLKGLLEPIDVVMRGGEPKIINGISRYFACRELGWKKLPVKIHELSDDEINEQFVYKNYKTRRSIMELLKQALVILGVLGLSQGKVRERIGDIEMGDDEFSLVGKDRFQIACDLIGADIKASSLRRLIAVKQFVDNGDDEIKGLQLLEKLDSGEMKIHNAWNAMNNYILFKKQEGSNALTESLDYVRGKNFELHNKSCENLAAVTDNSVPLAIHSGPYFQQRNYLKKGNDEPPEHGLERTPEEFIEKEVEIYDQVYKKLTDSGSLFVNISDSYDKGVDCLIPERLILKMVEHGWYVNQKWYWVKKNPKPQHNIKRLMPNVEVLIHFVKDPKKFYFRDFINWKEGNYETKRTSKDSGIGKERKDHGWTLVKPIERFRSFLDEQHVKNVIEANGFRWDELKEIDPNFRHLAPFPYYITLLPILMCSKIGDTVLDIFSGTGTTAAVALQLGRKAIGFDIDKVSHEFAAKRLNMVEQNLPELNEIQKLEKEFLEESNGDVQAA